MLLDRDRLGTRDVDQAAEAVLSFLRRHGFPGDSPNFAIVSISRRFWQPLGVWLATLDEML